jgi:mRNA interferase MazF
MNEGQIALADLPQATGPAKRRPVLLLRQMPGYGDYLVCGLSTQTRQYLPGFDELLTPDSTNKLRLASVVRLGFLDIVPAAQLSGIIGQIPNTLLTDLRQRLADYLTKP